MDTAAVCLSWIMYLMFLVFPFYLTLLVGVMLWEGRRRGIRMDRIYCLSAALAVYGLLWVLRPPLAVGSAWPSSRSGGRARIGRYYPPDEKAIWSCVATAFAVVWSGKALVRKAGRGASRNDTAPGSEVVMDGGESVFIEDAGAWAVFLRASAWFLFLFSTLFAAHVAMYAINLRLQFP